MSADKRTVTTDALETLGTIIGESEARDAIHLAVENAIAAHPLRPGDHIGWIDASTHQAGICDKPLGIVDPFLAAPVKTGQHFWFVVYPRKITSLRHVWDHPDFPQALLPHARIEDDPQDNSPKAVSMQWLHALADELDITHNQLMAAAEKWLRYDYYTVQYDSENWRDTMYEKGKTEAFWQHYSIVTGSDIPESKRENFFSYSFVNPPAGRRVAKPPRVE